MLPANVLVELPEGLEGDLVLAYGAPVVQHGSVLVLNLLSFKTNLEFAVHGIDIILDILKLQFGKGVDNLGQVLPADGALVPLAEHPHPGAAHVAHGVVALTHAEHLHLVHTHLAGILARIGALAHHALPGGNIHLGHGVLGVRIPLALKERKYKKKINSFIL